MYDILLPLSSDSSKPILVPQPPPHVPSLFPVPVKSSRAHLDLLNKPPTTYIGAVPLSLGSLATISEIADDENSSLSPSHTHEGSEDARPKSPRLKPLLYALSSTSYPLINFAPPPRPGSLTNRSFLLSEDLPERDQLLPYLLDPPAEEKGMTPVPNPGSIRFREKPDPGRKWLWWVVAVLGGLVVCGLGAAGSARRQASRQHHSSSTEKIPLLAVQNDVLRGEKSVTIVEPVPASTADTASAIMPTFTEDELTPIPKKKSSRRRIRGKKKFRGSDAAVYENEAEEDDRGEGGSSPPSSVSRKGDKPLPELPRVMSSIGLLDMDEKEKLVISDTVIGQSAEAGSSKC